jgi:hypothetical protein
MVSEISSMLTTKGGEEEEDGDDDVSLTTPATGRKAAEASLENIVATLRYVSI